MQRFLIVIDCQKGFVDGAQGFPGAEKLDAKITAKVLREVEAPAIDKLVFGMEVTDPAVLPGCIHHCHCEEGRSPDVAIS